MTQTCKDNLRDFGLLWLRVLMGCGIAYHGYGKIFGGGLPGFTQMVTGMGMPMPHVMAWVAALSEFAGGICVALGLFTRAAAFFVFSTMTVAAFIALDSAPYEKRELALAFWTISSSLVLMGPGRFSLDRLFCRCCKK